MTNVTYQQSLKRWELQGMQPMDTDMKNIFV